MLRVVFAVVVSALVSLPAQAEDTIPTIGPAVRTLSVGSQCKMPTPREVAHSIRVRGESVLRDYTEPSSGLVGHLTSYTLDRTCKSTACRDARVFDVMFNVGEMLAACQEANTSMTRCLSAYVTALAESGFKAHPGCGVSEQCASVCDVLPNGAERQKCFVTCAKEEGASTLSARKCNDGGTSRGWFQMKALTVERCAKLGVEANPHNVYTSTICYLRLVEESEKSLGAFCPKGGWKVAWKRVGAGPFMRGTLDPECRNSQYANRAVELERVWFN